MNLFAHAENIAAAACFFDPLRGLLPEKYRAEAEHHVQRMHDAAEFVAADRAIEIYGPDETPTEHIAAMCAAECES